MKKQALILDAAHGKDTPGKRSPDGSHREYMWSRRRIIGIINNLIKIKDLKFDLYYPTVYEENEIGLTKRVLLYNEIAEKYDNTFVYSIHNNAQRRDQCNKEGWGTANGISVWTNKVQDKSDTYATDLFYFLKDRYPNSNFREVTWLTEGEKKIDPDWEANFTVLAGNKKKKIFPNYHSVLLEWLFQTNLNDVQSLNNNKHSEYFESVNTQWLLKTFNV
jgi:N-acetylmuramoyl-L-alanine amidase